MKLLYYICVIVLFASCQSSQESKDGKSNQGNQSNAAEEAQFKSIPQELALKIFNECDLIDFIFHIYPFSMSQDQKPSIQANVNYISPEPMAYIPQGLKPIARQFYSSQGNIFLEADVYYSEEHRFYVFIENGQPSYANKMTPAGVNFFNTMISNAMNAAKGLQ